MIVVTLTACPPAIRGDLTKWLFEINTGVYVGNVSARVREMLWERVCDNVKDGRATMVFSTNNEQRFDFKAHNTSWQPTDFDGLKLMMRPSSPESSKIPAPSSHFSRAAKIALARKAQYYKSQKAHSAGASCIFIDLETTGLSEDTARIIEISALEAENDAVLREYHVMIRQEEPLSPKIVQLTGITDDVLQAQGISQKEALIGLKRFISGKVLISHNIRFDMRFLCAAFKAENLPVPNNPTIDTLTLAREHLQGLPNYRLTTVANHFQIPTQEAHTSRGDCLMTMAVYQAISQLQKSQ